MTPRIPELDGIRGAAILLVLAGHMGMILGYHAPWLGTIGVNIFFVLSGYLITGILMRKPSLTHFYRRRALKVLEHAHHGPHNSQAWKILRGEE